MLLKVLCVALVVSAGSGAAANASAPPPGPCRDPGRVVAADADAAVVRAGGTLWGCTAGGAPLRFDTAEQDSYAITGIQLAGRYAGFTDLGCAARPCPAFRTILDLRTGRRSMVTVGHLDTPPTATVVSPRGFTAWAAGGEVRLLALGGGARTLDAGPGVDERSLAVAGGRLYWVRDGVVYTATIGRPRPSGAAGPRGLRGNVPPPCGRRYLMAATRNAAIVVFRRRYHPRMFACLRGGPARPMGIHIEYGELRGATLGGRFVGWVDPGCDKGECLGMTVLMDLRSGERTVARTPGYEVRVPRSLVVSRRGFMAWGFDDGIHLLRAGGRDELLDDDAGIDPRSVALAGDRVYWVRDGTVQTRVVE